MKVAAEIRDALYRAHGLRAWELALASGRKEYVEYVREVTGGPVVVWRNGWSVELAGVLVGKFSGSQEYVGVRFEGRSDWTDRLLAAESGAASVLTLSLLVAGEGVREALVDFLCERIGLGPHLTYDNRTMWKLVEPPPQGGRKIIDKQSEIVVDLVNES